MKEKTTIIAISLALLACLIWAGNFVIARGVYQEIPPVTLAFWRWVVAFIALLPFAYKQVVEQMPIIKKSWVYIALMGSIGVGGFNTLVYVAAHYTTAHHISLISSLSPIGIVLIAASLGFEPLTKNKIIGSISAFIGAVIIISHGSLDMILNLEWNKGDLLLLLTASIWAAWGALLHYKPKELGSKSFLVAQMAVAIIVLIPFFIWEQNYVKATQFSFNSFIVYLYLGVGASVIAWLSWQEAVKLIGAVKTGLVYYTIPIFSSILAVIFLNEDFELYHLIGFVMIFFGIISSNLNKLKK